MKRAKPCGLWALARRRQLLRVILLQNVDNLGSAGEVVEVKPGYARNALIPRRVAVYSTPENLATHKDLIASAAQNKAAAGAAAPVASAEASSSVSGVTPAPPADLE